MAITPEQLKAKFRREGKTLSDWARQHGYTPHRVYRVVGGFDKGHYGMAHNIAVQLGLKDGELLDIPKKDAA